jgi:hypothetical protein
LANSALSLSRAMHRPLSAAALDGVSKVSRGHWVSAALWY